MFSIKSVGRSISKGTNIELRDFVHLSFDGNLEGIWTPRLPYGTSESGGEFSEPDWPRISVSENIEGAFRAIYPNVSKYFEVEGYPYMDFFVYSPSGKRVKMINPLSLVTGKFVHDAMVTREHVILEKVSMSLLGKVRVYNTSSDSGLFYRPFNDKTSKEIYHSPKVIRYTDI